MFQTIVWLVLLAAENDLHANSLDEVVALVNTYCVDCHNSSEAAADLDLESFETEIAKFGDQAWDTDRWEKMVKRLRGRQMPPADVIRPTEAEYEDTLTLMESALDSMAQKHPRPGRTATIRRLTRTEYRNAVRDLLAVEIDVDTMLPPDESGHGFDNVNVSDMSPLLLNRYITAAQRISRIAVGGKRRGVGGVTFRVPEDQSQDTHVDGLPLGTRGGALFRHTFDRDGDYEIELRLTRDRDGRVEGLKQTHELDILLDRDLVHRFTVRPPKNRNDQNKVDAHLKTRFHASAGPHDIGVTFPSKSSKLLEIKRQPFDASYNLHRHPRQNPAILQASIAGPFDSKRAGDSPSRRRIFTRWPGSDEDELDVAKEIIRPLIRLAYRRPANSIDLETPIAFFLEESEHNGFEAGIEAAIASILVNPNFLFRVERDPDHVEADTAYRMSDLELASRLSFFLWSSIPDDELLRRAEAGHLSRSDVLREQVQRMLNDPRSHSLVTNFASQWLYLRNLSMITPDLRQFPGFDNNLRQAFRYETELLFESVLRNNRSVLDLIRSDTTYLNERLAKHYGIPHVKGSHFRPVALNADSHRGGLLRHGSILTVTSYATRTSPTIRGNWVLKNILGTPAPPPPPNVPSLDEKQASLNLPIRERLAEHRRNPQCASCHNLIDPVGFSLENFDAVGRWRDLEKGQLIDARGKMPDGTEINNIDELEQRVLEHPEMFVGTLTEKLLTFALGRGIQLSDGPAIRSIVRTAAEDQFRSHTLIEAIVSSTPFQMRMSE